MVKYNSAVPTSNCKRIIFQSRERAYQVIDALYEDCDLFMRTSMARFKMYCGIVPITDADRNRGWDKSALDKFEIKPGHSGYELTFSTPEPIEPLPAYYD